MLLLTRRPGEEIVVIDKETGEEMVIALLRHVQQGTMIGIEASKDRFTVLRREVLERDREAVMTLLSTIWRRLRAEAIETG